MPAGLGSPTTSLDRWVPSAAAGDTAQHGPSRPNLAATMQLALGSQESRSEMGRPTVAQEQPAGAADSELVPGPLPAAEVTGTVPAPLELEQLHLDWRAAAAAATAGWERGLDEGRQGAQLE